MRGSKWVSVFALLVGVTAADTSATDVNWLVEWEFTRNGTGWQKVRVPHDWAIEGPFDREIDRQIVAIEQNGEKIATEKTGRTGSLPWIGSGEYRTCITIPEGVGFASLVFDGVMSEPDVFFDGKKVGEWKCGYNAFEVVLPTEPGDHEVRVAVRNLPESSRWYPGAGIIRPVRLVLGDATGVRTWGQAISCPDLHTVKVNTECRGKPAKVAYRVLDGDKTVTTSATGVLTGDFTPWSPEHPHLYTLETTVFNVDDKVVDRVTARFGVRTLFYGDGVFKLNGQARKFKGVCLHHDLGPLGAAFDADAFRRQVILLKEMGCDSIRTAHNMPGEDQLAICDELGMMVMAESFDSWKDVKVANGYNRFFDGWWRRDITNLVLKCRNHPSVVMWSIGNEITEQIKPVGVNLAREMQELCHALDLDPGRKVTQGLSWMPQAIESGVNAVMEIPGVTYRLPFYEAMHKATKTGVVLGAETASTVSSRGEYFFPVQIGPFVRHPGAQCSGYDVECCPWSNLPDDDWAMQDDHPWAIGEFVWTGFDYLGEPTPYDEVWPSRSSYFGIFDLAGLPKDRYWLYRSRWNTSSHTLHLVPHWTFPGREGKVMPVYCYTDFEEAELFVNGKSQGRKRKDKASRLDRFRLRWNEVIYEPGELKVVAYDRSGNPAKGAIVRTAGVSAGLKQEKRRYGKLLFVTVSVVDAKGEVVPDADDTIEVSCLGNLRFKAICNGDPTSLESFQRPRMKAFHGKLVAIFEGEGDKVECMFCDRK